MKQYLFTFFMILGLAGFSIAQNGIPTVDISNYSQFPAYKLLNTDSISFSSLAVLKKGKPTLLMYFSPTCSHCQHMAEELTGHIKELSDLQILMVSAYTLSEIKVFANSFGLNKFSNILVAYDPDFKMGGFYKLTSLPGLFLYDKKATFVTKFDPNISIGKIKQTLLAN